VPTSGAISPQTSPLPSESLSYPSPTQDPVVQPKRVVIGRTAALRLRFRLCITPASKNQVEPNSGSRQGSDFKKNSPLPSESASYPSPTQDPVAPPKQIVVGRTAALRPRLRLCLTPASKNQVETSSGCRHEGDFTKKTRHCPRTIFPTRRPPKTPLLHRNESSSAIRQRYGSDFVRA
jgi:hypothetical protein